MAEIKLTRSDVGGADLRFASAEIRESVALDGLEQADSIPALAAIVLDFDHYGRLVGIDILHSAESTLPPALFDDAEHT